jgi:hypothetical protein
LSRSATPSATASFRGTEVTANSNVACTEFQYVGSSVNIRT